MKNRRVFYSLLSLPVVLLILVAWMPLGSPVTASSDLVEVRNAPGMGRGLFARVAIREGTAILRDVTIEVSKEDVAALSETKMAGHFFYDHEAHRGYIVFGKTSMVNHSYRAPNVEPEWEDTALGPVVILRALRDIRAGEQLFFDYGFDEDNIPEWADNPRPVQVRQD